MEVVGVFYMHNIEFFCVRLFKKEIEFWKSKFLKMNKLSQKQINSHLKITKSKVMITKLH